MKLSARFKVAIASLSLLAMGSSALAATWNLFFKLGSLDKSVYYFDADSVLKAGDSVTLWVKDVKTKNPDSNGAWANANRWVVDCKLRTIQLLTTSRYDKSGGFMGSSPGSPPFEIPPDSYAEGMHKAACTPDFPNNKSGDLYAPVKSNDIFLNTRQLLEYAASQKDEAPK